MISCRSTSADTSALAFASPRESLTLDVCTCWCVTCALFLLKVLNTARPHYLSWLRRRLRQMVHAKGERLPEEVKGTHHSKAVPIGAAAQNRILIGRAQKKVRLQHS